MPRISKPKLTIHLEKDQNDLLLVLADQRKMSVEDLVVGLIINAARSKDRIVETIESLPLPQGAETNFDSMISKPAFVEAPAALPAKQAEIDPYLKITQQKQQERADKLVGMNGIESSHACIHLTPGGSQHFRASECEGICSHPTQIGRVCFNPSAGAANSCQQFEAKRSHIRHVTG